MPKKRKDLPEPPRGPFGRRRPSGEGTEAPRTADLLAEAMMKGRVEEFMEEEFGDVPRAKELAMMMLGATGMMPASPKSKAEGKASGIKPAGTHGKKAKKPPEAPKEVLEAAEKGDVETLGKLLADALGEHSGGKAPRKKVPGEPNFDKADIDTILEIAAKNNVSADWVLARAIKLYARDYRATGRI